MTRNVNFTVLYPTNNATDRWFIPANGPAIDKENSGDGMTEEQDMADQLAFCQRLVDVNQAGDQIGQAVQPDTLADWP